MKKISLVLFSLVHLNLISQEWEWAKSAYGTGSKYIECSDVDPAGDLYVSGTFPHPEITFGAVSLIRNNAYDKTFLVKYSPSGNVLWAMNTEARISSITHDPMGYLYLSGAFDAPLLTLGSWTLVNDTLYGENMFVAKIDPAGNFIWAIQAGGNSVESISSSATDNSGNTYITGGFNSSTVTLGNTVLHNTNSSNNIFTAKVDDTGNILWAKGIGGYLNSGSFNYGMTYSIAADQIGNCYILGRFSDSLLIIENDTIENSGNAISLFIVKYDNNGTKQWAKRITDGNGYRYHKLHCDQTGNLYMAGSFKSSSITFGSFTLPGPDDTEHSVMDLVKYDTNGNVLWARTSDGSYTNHSVVDLKSDNEGNIYVIGDYGFRIVLGNDTLRSHYSTLSCSSERVDPPAHGKMFIAGFDPSGSVIFTRGIGEEGYDRAGSLIPDNNGNLYVTGQFTSDSIKIGSTSLINSETTDDYNNVDIFVAKLNMNLIGMNENANTYNFIVFPNPSAGLVNIINQGSEKTKCRLYNTLGKIVLEESELLKSPSLINLETLQKGIYFIELSAGKNRQVKKIVIQ
jgi:hypothetical protein